MDRAGEADTLRQRLGAAPVGSGFRMDGWFVWCGSAIEVDGEYHLFAARWPVASGFPDGYRDHSVTLHPLRAARSRPAKSSFLSPATIHIPILGTWEGREAKLR